MMITRRKCILGAVGFVILFCTPFALFYLYRIVFVPHIFDGQVLRIVLDAKGKPNEAAITGALQSRFPVGSLSQGILDYTKNQSGNCNWSNEEKLHSCYFVIGGALCIANNVVLRFPEGKISQPIKVIFWADGC